MAIGPFVCDSRNITKQKEIEKIMQCPSIKSPFWYDSGFLLKGRYYYEFITKKLPKKHFLNGISSKSFKFLDLKKFDWCISILYTIKNSPKNSITNLTF